MFKMKPSVLLVEGCVSHFSFDDNGNEGLVSTTDNTIWYVN